MTCAKVRVECWLIHPTGIVFYGSNDCDTPQVKCPREEGEGYDKCGHVCNQQGHAEQVALRKAGEYSHGCIAFVTHKRICPTCEALLYKHGVDRVYLASLAPVFWQK